jgi:hypothetical protein
VLLTLTPNTAYNFEVKARDGAGNRSVTAGTVTFTSPLGVPDAPTGLNYWLQADCSWRATWSAPPGATKYHFRENAGSAYGRVRHATSVSCPQGDSAANKPKWVQACNAQGCGLKSNF